MKDIGMNWRIRLKWIVRKQDESEWTDLIWLRTGIDGGSL